MIDTISIVWNKASNEDLQRYSEVVNHRLQDISLPDDIVHCTEPFATTTNMIWILIARQFVIALLSLQMCVFLHCKRVAGWNESACLLKQQASFWHQLCGCPSVGVTATIRKKTKQHYKAEAR